MNHRIFTLTPNPGIDHTMTVPEVRLNVVLRSLDIRKDPGGKGFNVARSLKALGVESTALAFVGGHTGDLITDLLSEWGVDTHLVRIRDETRTNWVVTDPQGRQHVKVNEPGPVITPEENAALTQRVETLAQAGDLWVLAGSLARGLAVDFYRDLVQRVQSKGARAVLDASGAALAAGIQAAPYLVKPNALEAEEATGIRVESPADAAAAVRELFGRGIQIVAVSMGADGLVLGGAGGEVVHARPPQVRALNAVGAGDAAVAGMVYALGQEWSLAEVARWGAANGTAAAMRAGVDFSPLDEVTAMARRVSVSIL